MEKYAYSDCLHLIENFAKGKTTDFEHFCKQWKGLRFHQIFLAQTTDNMLLQTTKCILDFARYTLVKDQNELKRIGGLYLMYAVYYKQPVDRFLKIPVSLKSWNIITGFVSELKERNEAQQAQIIFWKLVKEHAFRFVFAELYFHLDNFKRHALIDRPENSRSPTDQQLVSQMHEITDEQSGFLKAFGQLEDGYNEMKELLNERDAKEEICPLPMTSIVQEFKSVFDDIQDILKGRSKPSKKKEKEKEKPSIHSRREEIREKAIANLGQFEIKSVADRLIDERENKAGSSKS